MKQPEYTFDVSKLAIYQAILAVLGKKARREGECLIWHGARDALGYGVLKLAGKIWLTHRLVWIVSRGEIEPGFFICHHCDNPSCVRIEHLFYGSPADNNADRHRKGRTKGFGASKYARLGTAHPHAALTDEKVRAIYGSSEPLKVLAERYGVSVSTISGIRLGKSWGHVTR